MDISTIAEWKHDAADLVREEKKRKYSPSSFFFSQGRALVLAAEYFTDKRLAKAAHEGVAAKHRHRIHLALFGQLMASLEYLFKGFIARVVDLVPSFDGKLCAARWITVDTERVLSSRGTQATPGNLLLHTSQGWHDPAEVNRRYADLLRVDPVAKDEIQTLGALWALRHSVAHNAGYVTGADAFRGGLKVLSERVADIQAQHVCDAFEFLCRIARRIAEKGGTAVLRQWLSESAVHGPDFDRDVTVYEGIKWLGTCVESRAKPLPKITPGMYNKDWAKVNSPSARRP